MMAIDWKWVAKVAGVSAAVGTVAGTASWFIFKKLEERKANEALEEYGEPEQWSGEWSDEIEEQANLIFPDGVNEEGSDGERGVPFDNKPSLSEMVDYTKFYPVHRKGTDEDGDRPQSPLSYVTVISEDEFVKGTGNLDGYVSVTGTWFAEDGVLAGWDDDLDVRDISSTVGKEAISAFDDENVDAVYVRNDLLKVLYEIVRGDGSYKTAKDEVGYSDDEDEG